MSSLMSTTRSARYAARRLRHLARDLRALPGQFLLGQGDRCRPRVRRSDQSRIEHQVQADEVGWFTDDGVPLLVRGPPPTIAATRNSAMSGQSLAAVTAKRQEPAAAGAGIDGRCGIGREPAGTPGHGAPVDTEPGRTAILLPPSAQASTIRARNARPRALLRRRGPAARRPRPYG